MTADDEFCPECGMPWPGHGVVGDPNRPPGDARCPDEPGGPIDYATRQRPRNER